PGGTRCPQEGVQGSGSAGGYSMHRLKRRRAGRRTAGPGPWSRYVGGLPVVAAAKVLVDPGIDRLLEESDRAVGQGAISPTRVPGLEPRGNVLVLVGAQRGGPAPVVAVVVGERVDLDDGGQRPAGAGQGPVAVATYRLIGQGLTQQECVGQAVSFGHGES